MTFRPVVSRNIIVTTVIINGVLLAGAILLLFLGYQTHGRGPASYALSFGGCLNFLFLIGSSAFRIRSYEIHEDKLVVHLGLGRKVFQLSGLQDARVVENPFAGAIREMGIGGLWSMYGRFRSPVCGGFSAYAASTASGVLLSWPDQKVLLAPDDPDLFMQSLRAAK